MKNGGNAGSWAKVDSKYLITAPAGAVGQVCFYVCIRMCACVCVCVCVCV